MQNLLTRAWVEIDLGALVRNGVRIADAARAPLLPMVKADAYGLGAVRVARALETLGPWGFGVATVEEGEELRRAHVDRPILVFTPVLLESFDALRRFRLTPALGTRAAIGRWGEYGLPWHLAIDTGMNRAGIAWSEVASLADVLRAHPPEGVFTHFHSAEDDAAREAQEARFATAVAALPARPTLVHAENSPAATARRDRPGARWSLTRPGVFLYGVDTHAAGRAAITPEAVVAVRARVVEIRDVAAGETVSYGATYRAPSARRVATLPIGYADGYRRALGNRSHVLIHGRRAPVVGMVTMDMTMVDVTGLRCAVGDVATLLGRDHDGERTVAAVAAEGDLSPYELLTGLRARLPRRYLETRRERQ